jgi:hypothetical protein
MLKYDLLVYLGSIPVMGALAVGAIALKGTPADADNETRKVRLACCIQTASFSSFATRNATFLLAAILMASPVPGLRPMRSSRCRTSRMPRPAIRMRSPFFRWSVIASTMPASKASACFLSTACVAATSAKIAFSAIVAGVADLGAGLAAGAEVLGAGFFAARADADAMMATRLDVAAGRNHSLSLQHKGFG